jgi:hypothetical protein
MVAKGDIGGAYRNQRAEEQRVKDVQVAPDVMGKVFLSMSSHNRLYQI